MLVCVTLSLSAHLDLSLAWGGFAIFMCLQCGCARVNNKPSLRTSSTSQSGKTIFYCLWKTLRASVHIMTIYQSNA